MKYRILLKLAGMAGLGLAGWAYGESTTPAPNDLTQIKIAIDTLWVILAAILVFFMQCGFAMFEIGLHAAKNTVNVLMKNTLDFVIATVAFWLVGFGLMFGNGNGLVGTEGFLLQGTFSSLDWTTVPIEAKFFFQLVFAGTASTIVSGAIGGRVKFTTYLVISLMITLFIYPVLGHWVWGGGWLATQGFFDFAGSTVVHTVGGFAALAAAMVVGSRIGRFNEDGSVNVLPSYNMSLVGLGVLILWLGWFGFNAGSTMAIADGYESATHILLTTNLAAAAGGLSAMIMAWVIGKKPDVSMTLNGVLAGLVSITAPCAWVTPVGALVIGIIGGILVFGGCILMDKLQIDDAVGAFPVHGICGIWGTLCVGLFTDPIKAGSSGPKAGLFYGGGFDQLWVQLYGTVLVAIAAFTLTYIGCFLLKGAFGLRVSREEEISGLDLAEHGHRGYYHELIPGDQDSDSKAA